MPVLCYHGVHRSWKSPLAVSPAQFAEHAEWLRTHRRVRPLGEVVQGVGEAVGLARALTAITFDDGFAELHEQALPILSEKRMPATVFLVAGTLQGPGYDVDWVDDPPTEPLRPLSRSQVLEMQAAGVTFGSHSYAHRDLTSLSGDACERDLRASREVLEELLGVPVRWLAYPRGRHNQGVREAAARAGFTHGFTLPNGREPAGPHALPRVGIWNHDGIKSLRLKSSGWYIRVRTSRAFPLARIMRQIRRAGVAA